MTGYLIDGETQQIAIARTMNIDGVTFEPWTDGESLGFRIIEYDTGRVEYLVLTPTGEHDYNPDNGAQADTFIYVVTGEGARRLDESGVAPADFGDAVTYINHFGKE